MAVLSGHVVEVTDHQYGNELDGDHAAGATSLTVVWTNDFDADGGQLYFGDDPANPAEGPITYTIPADPDNQDLPSATQINLGTALANPYTDGTSVWVFPKMVERWCWFMPPDGEEPIVARVPHQLVPLLPEGKRDADTAEQIEVGESGTDLVVSDVLAREASVEAPIHAIGLDLPEFPPGGDSVASAHSSITWGNEVVTASDVGDGRHTFTAGAVNGVIDPAKFALLNLIGGESSITDLSQLVAGFHVGTHQVDVIRGDGTSDFELATSDGWQNWTPTTLTGWSANPTNSVYRYKQIGKTVMVVIRQATNGTSNLTTKSITAPVPAATVANMIWAEQCSATDNGVALTTSAQASIASGSSTINFAKDLSAFTGGWTASGGHKIAACTLFYEAA